MRIDKHLAAIAALCVLGPLASAQEETPPPDRITLKSGTVLTGTIDMIDSENVKIATDDLGDQTVSLDDVSNLEAASFLLGTTDDARTDVSILGVESGALRVRTASEVKSVPFGDLEEVVGGREGVEWKGAIGAGLFRSFGNTERRSANVNADATRRTEDDRLILGFRWNYDDVKSGPMDVPAYTFRLNDRRTLGTARYDYFVSDKVFAYGRAFAESDFNARVDLRYSFDAGLGWQIFDGDDVSYSLQLGVGYIDSNYAETVGVASNDSASMTGVASHNFDWQIIEDLELLHDASATQSLETKQELVVKTNTRLRWTMIDDFFTELQHTFDYNGSPPAGSGRIDNRFFLNVGYAF